MLGATKITKTIKEYVDAWRHEQALQRTRERRPELLSEKGDGDPIVDN